MRHRITKRIQQLFCRHDWEKKVGTRTLIITAVWLHDGKQSTLVSATCKKCDKHKTYWDY